MAIHNSQEVSKKLSETPEDVQDFMSSSKCISSLVAIGEKYNLHVDQTGKLSDQVVYTMIGLENLSDLHGRIIKELGISDDTANLIIYDLNQEVFGPIRESMLAMVKQKVQAETASQNPAMSAPPAMTIGTQSAQSSALGAKSGEAKKYGTGGVFGVPKSEVDVKAKASDNIKVEPPKIPTDPYHEPVS